MTIMFAALALLAIFLLLGLCRAAGKNDHLIKKINQDNAESQIAKGFGI